MRGRSDCPHCKGEGSIITGKFPDTMSRDCSCVRGSDIAGLPERFRHVDLDEVRQWWLGGPGAAGVVTEASHQESWDLLERIQSGISGPPDSRENIATIQMLKACLGNDPTPSTENLVRAAMPMGFQRAVESWVSNDRGEDLWISGPSSSGKTSLAIALMKARCKAKNSTGAFASALSIGDALRAYYNRTVGAGTWTERMSMTKDPGEIYMGLMEPECLVLDLIDCLPNDKRVAENFVNVLSERFNANKVTIFTAFETSVALQHDRRHPFSSCEAPGLLVMSRLASIGGVQMVPALKTIHDRMNRMG